VGHFEHLLGCFLAFLRSEPLLQGAVDELLRENPEAEKKATQIRTERVLALRRRDQQPHPAAPTTTEEEAAIGYHILTYLKGHPHDLSDVGFNLIGGSAQVVETIWQCVIQPLCDVLDEMLDAKTLFLGLLLRYKQRSEWFNREELLRIVDEEEHAATARKTSTGKATKAQVERALKLEAFRYLHDQGITFTHEVTSPSGDIDIVLALSAGSKVYIEAKVFDNEGRKKDKIEQGFRQTLQYLNDHNTSSGYYLIYRTCEESLNFPADGTLQEIPYITHAGKTVYIVQLDIHRRESSASKAKGAHIEILRSALLPNETAD
jgi:hypothetical protein